MQNQTIKLTETFLAQTYAKYPIEVADGYGSTVLSADGKEYIDLSGGCGVNILGMKNKMWLDAVETQLNRTAFCSNVFYNAPAAHLAEQLCVRTKMQRVFFSNSGAEANETAIKAARKYASSKKGAEFTDIITLKMGFHGRTVTALSATGQPAMQCGFAPLTAGFYYIDDDEEQLKQVLSGRKVAAIMIELIRGEGGVLPASRGFIRAAAQAAKTDDILLIVDEVQTGVGRCGKLFGYEKYDIIPDIITTAKGLGGGLPIGATIFGEKTRDVFKKGEHGSTFGSNPLSCAAASAVLKQIDDELLNEVNKKSEYIFSHLQGQNGIKSISGTGLMIGVETEKNVDEVLSCCIKNGVIAIKAKQKIRLLPALNIPWEQLEKAVEIMIYACK